MPTRITHSDGELLGIAGLYERHKVRDAWAYCFTILMLNHTGVPLTMGSA